VELANARSSDNLTGAKRSSVDSLPAIVEAATAKPKLRAESAGEEEDEVAGPLAALAYRGHFDPQWFDMNNTTSISIRGAPRPLPNFTYKLKIFIGFIQIVGALNRGVDVIWPSRFKQLLLWLNVLNVDFVIRNATNVDCAQGFDYYWRWLLIVLALPALFVAIFCFFYVPRRLRMFCFSRLPPQRPGQLEEDVVKEFNLRTSMYVWNIVLYLMFLFYPSVSRAVIGHYVCRDVEGVEYLQTDFRVQCDSERWRRYARFMPALIVVYPVGIPLFFFFLLYTNREVLHSKKVRARLQLLYAGYRVDVWWFEILDHAHKLAMTCLIAFAPRGVQMPLGMGIVCLYLFLSMRVHPFVRWEDDVLHSLSLVIILHLLLAGHIFYSDPFDVLDEAEDWLLSALLIAVTFIFVAFFLYWAAITLARWCGYHCLNRQARENEQREKERRLSRQRTRVYRERFASFTRG
jgi:hypothetical protein